LKSLQNVSAEILVAAGATVIIFYYVFPFVAAFALITLGLVGILSPRLMRVILATLAGLWAAVAGILAVLGLFAFASGAAGLAAVTILFLSHH
jgi:hypothetical protein